MPIETDDWGLDAVVGGAQKAFMIPPGLAFVACSPRGWEIVQGERSTPRYYLDLRKYAASAAQSSTPFTPAIGLLQGLEAALEAIGEAGGIASPCRGSSLLGAAVQRRWRERRRCGDA